jgi:hypothetical protein
VKRESSRKQDKVDSNVRNRTHTHRHKCTRTNTQTCTHTHTRTHTHTGDAPHFEKRNASSAEASSTVFSGLTQRWLAGTDCSISAQFTKSPLSLPVAPRRVADRNALPSCCQLDAHRRKKKTKKTEPPPAPNNNRAQCRIVQLAGAFSTC